MTTSISFSETLYIKQITDQRKNTAKTKLTPGWESDEDETPAIKEIMRLLNSGRKRCSI